MTQSSDVKPSSDKPDALDESNGKSETPHVYQIALLVLFLEWVFFGSGHFALPAETAREIPPFILRVFPYPTFIVVVSGIIEVVIGFLVLLPKTRRLASITSLSLLALYIFPIYRMLADDQAITGPVAWRVFVRLILVPNHVLLILCSLRVYTLSRPAKGLFQTIEDFFTAKSSDAPRSPKTSTGTSGVSAVLLTAVIMLTVNIAGFIVILQSPWDYTMVSMWALMCLAAGGLIGFLFGIPKTNRDASKSKPYAANSNIEDVSDWLTKIIVGVGLIELNKVSNFVRELSTNLGKSLIRPQSTHSLAEATSFAQAQIVYFFCAGVIQAYLLTRMYLSKEFASSESSPQNAVAQKPTANEEPSPSLTQS